MKINPVGSNQTEVEKNGNTVLFSYKTPVAVFVPGRGALVTADFYSRTTSKHIGLAVKQWGATKTVVPQSEIEKLANG
jgi:hypothetical protein